MGVGWAGLGNTGYMSQALPPRPSPFLSNVWDTSSLIFIGVAGMYFPVSVLLGLMGIGLVWASRRWSLGEKAFAAFLPVFGYSLANSAGFLVPLFACAITAFALAFRMGMHDARATTHR